MVDGTESCQENTECQSSDCTILSSLPKVIYIYNQCHLSTVHQPESSMKRVQITYFLQGPLWLNANSLSQQSVLKMSLNSFLNVKWVIQHYWVQGWPSEKGAHYHFLQELVCHPPRWGGTQSAIYDFTFLGSYRLIRRYSEGSNKDDKGSKDMPNHDRFRLKKPGVVRLEKRRWWEDMMKLCGDT